MIAKKQVVASLYKELTFTEQEKKILFDSEDEDDLSRDIDLDGSEE